MGVASVIAPAYIAEVAPAHLRGRLGSLQQLAIVLGTFVALVSDAFFARMSGGASHALWLGAAAWRWMFIADGVFAAFAAVSFFFVVRSVKEARGKELEDMVD